VKIIDDFSSGSEENLVRMSGEIEAVKGTVSDRELLRDLFDGADIVFHLAAIHGGRGFIETYPGLMMENLALDRAVFSSAEKAGVPRVVHASSACVYPIGLQSSSSSRELLAETAAGFDYPEQSFPDGAYGWSKLMGEYQLKTVSSSSTTLTGRSARIFTAYGSRENESHAIVALWAKASLRLDPFPVWGDGHQTRNFTHVSDIVHGLALLGLDSRPIRFDEINIGSSTHHTIIETIEEIFDIQGWRPSQLSFELDKPVGVQSRAADNSKVASLFSWQPSVSLRDGLMEMGTWYDKERLPLMGRDELEARLLSR
jgi:nucleoside-diphosphate-sugar epimerase